MVCLHDFVLIFLHLAKTAGTTLGGVLRRIYSDDQQVSLESDRQSALGLWPLDHIARTLGNLPDDRKKTIAFVGGHIPFGIHKFLPRQARYICFVRHPVDRVISGYYYSIHQQMHRMPSIDEFHRYVSAALDLGLDNYMTRVLSGMPDLDTFKSPAQIRDVRSVTGDDLAAAKRHIDEHFEFIGLVERFDESLMLLRSRFGWRMIDLLSARYNVTKDRPSVADFPADTVRCIERHNLFDLGLYAHAEQKFNKWLQQTGPSLAADVHGYRLLNSLHGAGASRVVLDVLEEAGARAGSSPEVRWNTSVGLAPGERRALKCHGGSLRGGISSGDYSAATSASRPFDASVEGFWVSLQNDPYIVGKTYIGFDFGNSADVEVTRFSLQQGTTDNRFNSVAAVDVQYSDDGFLADINTAASVPLVNDCDIRSYRIAGSRRARYWRVLARRPTGGGRWVVSRLVFNPRGPVEPRDVRLVSRQYRHLLGGGDLEEFRKGLREKGELREESAGAALVAAGVRPALEGVDLAAIFPPDVKTDMCPRRPSYESEEHRSGDGKARIIDYALFDSVTLWPAVVATGRPVDIYYKIMFGDGMARPLIGLTIKTLAGQSVFASNNLWMERRLSPVRAGEVKVYRLAMDLVLPAGKYSLEFAVASSVEAISDRREGIALLEIVDDRSRTVSGIVDFEEVGEYCEGERDS